MGIMMVVCNFSLSVAAVVASSLRRLPPSRWQHSTRACVPQPVVHSVQLEKHKQDAAKVPHRDWRCCGLVLVLKAPQRARQSRSHEQGLSATPTPYFSEPKATSLASFRWRYTSSSATIAPSLRQLTGTFCALSVTMQCPRAHSSCLCGLAKHRLPWRLWSNFDWCGPPRWMVLSCRS
jgi:hypothetical protein